MDHDPFTDDPLQHLLKTVLDGLSSALALPATEGRSIIGNQKSDFHAYACLQISGAWPSSQSCRIWTAAAWSITPRCSRLVRPAS